MTIRSTIAVGLHAFDQEISDMQNAVLELLGVFVSSILSIAAGGTNSGTALSGSSIMISNSTQIVQGAAGTTTTLLHGNAAGAPTYSAVSMTADVTGTLPVGNGGTGSATQNFVDLTTAQASIGGAKGFTSSGCTIVQPSWTGITYAGAWTDFGGGYGAVEYMKDTLGFVHLRGLAKGNGAANGSTITTLPSGYRPAPASAFFPCDAGGGYGRMNITSAGVVTNDVGNGTVALSFDGITYVGT